MKIPKQIYTTLLIYAVFMILLLVYYHNMLKTRKIKPQEENTIEVVQVYTEEEKEPERQFLGTYTIYAYCPCEKCCGKTNGITASGTKATVGRTVASTLPFGTKIYIDGIGERIVEDRGGGITDGKIDLYMDCHTEALKFGARILDVWELRE